jgi:hypothetical protein
MDPLEAFREALALARRAGMSFIQAYHPAMKTALRQAPTRTERDEWEAVLRDHRPIWQRAYERTGAAFPL